MGRILPVLKRAAIAFYDDQGTHHAAAITYYTLMSLFPVALLSVSLLGLLGQYPETYDAIFGYLADVAPAEVVEALDSTLRDALEDRGRAAIGLLISVVFMLYGSTGALEAARRALNVVFEVESGRSFVRRKTIDVGFTFVLIALAVTSVSMIFVGGAFARDIFGFLGLGSTAADVWAVARWPGAVAVAMLIFSLVYYVTPDIQHRGFRWITPGAVAGVALWLVASYGFSLYISSIADVGAVYGAFAGAIVLVGWIWLTNVALLFGGELNAEIEREREVAAGTPRGQTLDRPARRG